jgi:mannosyltransferase OCH1-like enzyme
MLVRKTRKNKKETPIPKILHQIWIGENVMPSEWMDTVKDFCKKYQYKYKLWTESNIDTLKWNEFNGLKKAYTDLEFSLAGRSDIIRLLVLYEYGGIYIDADTVILKPAKFNQFLLNNKANVFFGYEHILDKGKEIFSTHPNEKIRKATKYIANGVVGSSKAHAFIKHLLEKISKYVKKVAPAWQMTGPLFISDEYFKHEHKYKDIKIYPTKYFYPITWHNITDVRLHTKIKIPKESMLFQYGYSTNKFQLYFNNCKTRKNKQ